MICGETETATLANICVNFCHMYMVLAATLILIQQIGACTWRNADWQSWTTSHNGKKHEKTIEDNISFNKQNFFPSHPVNQFETSLWDNVPTWRAGCFWWSNSLQLYWSTINIGCALMVRLGLSNVTMQCLTEDPSGSSLQLKHPCTSEIRNPNLAIETSAQKETNRCTTSQIH